jgi:hypothetical protein
MSSLNGVVALFRDAARGVEKWFFAPADPRAYASLRIAYSIAAFSVLICLWPFRLVLFSSVGMFGGAVAGDPAPLNVFLWARSETSVTVVMVLAGAAIVCLGLGVLPRLSAIATYIWVMSYSGTGIVASCGWDTIMRVVGFVVVVSPTVSTWSLGAKRRHDHPPVYGLRLAQWQLMLIYVCTLWLKAPDPYWRNGETIQYFMMSMFARFPSPALARMSVLGGLLAYGTLIIEATVPFLLWVRKTRWLGVFLGLSLHVGIAIASKLALFTLAMFPMYAAFLERDDFDRIEGWIGRVLPSIVRRRGGEASTPQAG